MLPFVIVFSLGLLLLRVRRTLSVVFKLKLVRHFCLRPALDVLIHGIEHAGRSFCSAHLRVRLSGGSTGSS